jgi:hypothetical protein
MNVAPRCLSDYYVNFPVIKEPPTYREMRSAFHVLADIYDSQAEIGDSKRITKISLEVNSKPHHETTNVPGLGYFFG